MKARFECLLKGHHYEIVSLEYLETGIATLNKTYIYFLCYNCGKQKVKVYRGLIDFEYFRKIYE